MVTLKGFPLIMMVWDLECVVIAILAALSSCCAGESLSLTIMVVLGFIEVLFGDLEVGEVFFLF
jgi:hypothetical protein